MKFLFDFRPMAHTSQQPPSAPSIVKRCDSADHSNVGNNVELKRQTQTGTVHFHSTFEVVDTSGDQVCCPGDVESCNEAEEKGINRKGSIKDALSQQIPSLLSYALPNQWGKHQSKEINENDNEQPSKQRHASEDGDGFEYQYYHSKMSHDIEWNEADSSNDNLFIISKDLFDHTESNELVEEINSYQHLENTHDLYSKQNVRIKRKRKWKFGSKHRKKDGDSEEVKTEDINGAVNCNMDASNCKSGLSVWTDSLNSMLTQAKHRMYSILANPSFKWDSRTYRHQFSLSNDVWVMGHCHSFDAHSMTSKQVIQCCVLDIYSKIWITYRSKFPPLLSSRYTSDAGWGCMLRTTQMMTAMALIIYHFGYDFTLRDLHGDDVDTLRKLNLYYKSLEEFNDDPQSAFSVHSMLLHGSSLYDKPVGHWFAPNETCQMIKRCIECSDWKDKIECIVGDSGTIYKSDFSLKKHALILLPLRFGLDSLNTHYVESIKRCFELKECIGIIGGKPQRSLYFIGYQENPEAHLFYLDPHTVFPSPNPQRPLSRQKCVFHCQEINSIDGKLLDPSMAIGFFIKPRQDDLDHFWQNASKLTNCALPCFSLANQRPSYDVLDELADDSSSNVDNEWEKL